MYYIPKAVVTKYCNLGGFKQQRFILSQFWKLGIQSQSDVKAVLPLKHPGKDSSLLLPVSSRGILYVCISISVSVFLFS